MSVEAAPVVETAGDLLLTRVSVHDNQPLSRVGLAAVLAAAGFDVTGDAERHNGNEPASEADVSILAVRSSADAVCVAEQARRLAVVALVNSNDDDQRLAQMAVAAGARGVLGPGVQPEDLAHAVALVVAGFEVLPHGTARRPTLGDVDTLRQLRPQQIDLARRLASDTKTGRIAGELGCSQRELERRMRKLYEDLGVESRVGAATWAVRAGLA